MSNEVDEVNSAIYRSSNVELRFTGKFFRCSQKPSPGEGFCDVTTKTGVGKTKGVRRESAYKIGGRRLKGAKVKSL